MRYLLVLIFLLAINPVKGQRIVSGGFLKPEQAIMDIRHYSINLEVDPSEKKISGFTEITLNLSEPAETLLLDLVQQMHVEKILVNNKRVAFIHETDKLIIRSSQPFQAGKIVVKVIYKGNPAIAKRPPWEGGFQWEKDSLGNPWIAISCQGEGGKIYFPCKDHPSDEPDEGADLFITVPKGLVVAGPGLLKQQNTRAGKSFYHWKTNYPISNYCLLFNIGKYKIIKRDYVTVNNNHVPMVFYVLEEHVSKAEHHLDLLENSAKVLEKYFGEYPWVKEKIGIVETPHLGMEHQTMIAYGNKFRYTQVGGKDFDWLMHHEFGHEWWANKVTNRDWAHMWIHEGICAFGDAMYTRDFEGEESYLLRMQKTGLAAQNKLPIVQGEEGLDAGKVYHGDIYGKAAFFMHTLRFVMGDSLFFHALKKLATDSAYTYYNTVTTNDVDELFSKAYGKKLTPLFNLFLRSTEKVEFSLKQTETDKYHLRVINLDFTLPLDVVSSYGISRIEVDQKGITIQSSTLPLIDPRMFYLKKLVIE